MRIVFASPRFNMKHKKLAIGPSFTSTESLSVHHWICTAANVSVFNLTKPPVHTASGMAISWQSAFRNYRLRDSVKQLCLMGLQDSTRWQIQGRVCRKIH